jgi:hypothetical protein
MVAVLLIGGRPMGCSYFVTASNDIAYFATVGGEKPLVSDFREPASRFMIRSRTRVVQRHPEGD